MVTQIMKLFVSGYGSCKGMKIDNMLFFVNISETNWEFKIVMIVIDFF